VLLYYTWHVGNTSTLEGFSLGTLGIALLDSTVTLVAARADTMGSLCGGHMLNCDSSPSVPRNTMLRAVTDYTLVGGPQPS
jgi:hypothetical protein